MGLVFLLIGFGDIMGARALRQTIACVVGLLLPAPGLFLPRGGGATTPAPTGAFLTS